MIVPITTEDQWTSYLENSPLWTPPGASMVVVAPHPDDEILGVGGLIAAQRLAGVDISLVAVTDGERAYDDAEPVGLGILRCEEQSAALQRVGVASHRIIRLRLPDSDVMAHLPYLVQRLSSLVSSDTHLLAPWKGDFHPDHEACGIAAEKVAALTGATLTSYFFWTWHRGTPGLLDGLPLRSFPLNPATLAAKTEALRCHRSQLEHGQSEPILPAALLLPAQRPFESFLTR